MKRWRSIIFPINGRTHFSYNCSSRDLTCDCEMVFFHILEKSLGIQKETKDTYTGISLGKQTFVEKTIIFRLNFSEASHLESQKAKADFPVRPLGAISPSTLPTHTFQIFHNKNVCTFTFTKTFKNCIFSFHLDWEFWRSGGVQYISSQYQCALYMNNGV